MVALLAIAAVAAAASSNSSQFVSAMELEEQPTAQLMVVNGTHVEPGNMLATRLEEKRPPAEGNRTLSEPVDMLQFMMQQARRQSESRRERMKEAVKKRDRMVAQAQEMMKKGPVGIRMNMETGEEELVQLERHATPSTWIGSYVIPLLMWLSLGACCLRRAQPELYELGEARALEAWKPLEAQVTRWIQERGITMQGVTRVAVSLYFLHEGAQVSPQSRIFTRIAYVH